LIEFNPSQLHDNQMYKLLSGSVVPRPIAWVSTISEAGGLNLAPFSFFTVASRNPPMLCFSIGPGVGERTGTEKDTFVNIKAIGEFVVNVVPSSLGNQMQVTAENVEEAIDEFKRAGVTPVESRIVRAKRVKEAPIQMECCLEQMISLGSDWLIIGRVTHYHIQEDVYLGDYKVDLNRLSPLGRLAGNYSEVGDIFTLPR